MTEEAEPLTTDEVSHFFAGTMADREGWRDKGIEPDLYGEVALRLATEWLRYRSALEEIAGEDGCGSWGQEVAQKALAPPLGTP